MPSLLISAGLEAQAVSLPEWLELASIVVGSLSGIIVARDHGLDVVGFMGLALLCGLGGGLIRDMMMQRGGVYMLDSPYAIGTSLATAVVLFLFPRLVSRFPRTFEVVDIVAVGLFAVMGADKAVVYGLNPLSAVLMGAVTGIGGGMLRDVFLGDVPRIFQRSNFYAVCAVCGAGAYWAFVTQLSVAKGMSACVGVVVCVGLRWASLRFGLLSPANVDLEPQVARPVRAFRRHSADDIILGGEVDVSDDAIRSVREALDRVDTGEKGETRG